MLSGFPHYKYNTSRCRFQGGLRASYLQGGGGVDRAGAPFRCPCDRSEVLQIGLCELQQPSHAREDLPDMTNESRTET